MSVDRPIRFRPQLQHWKSAASTRWPSRSATDPPQRLPRRNHWPGYPVLRDVRELRLTLFATQFCLRCPETSSWNALPTGSDTRGWLRPALVGDHAVEAAERGGPVRPHEPITSSRPRVSPGMVEMPAIASITVSGGARGAGLVNVDSLMGYCPCRGPATDVRDQRADLRQRVPHAGPHPPVPRHAQRCVKRFGSKHDLLVAVNEYEASKVEEIFTEIVARHESPLGALYAFIGTHSSEVRSPAEMANHAAFLHLDLSDDAFLLDPFDAVK